MQKLFLLSLLALLALGSSFNVRGYTRLATKSSRRTETTMVLDALAQLSIAASLSSSHAPSSSFMSRSSSMPVAVTEVKQGMYKEYTIEKVDDSALDEFRRGYKTAEETDDSKNKYWTILAVLVFGSFAIPMVQYYWYVAEED